MSKGLRTAAFQTDVVRARLTTEAGLPIEMRPAWGAYLVERAPDGLRPDRGSADPGAPVHRRRPRDGRAAGRAASCAPPGRAGGEAHELSVVAATAEQLLAAWLGELLYGARQTRRLFSTINVRRISPRHLRAELRAERETRWIDRSHVDRDRRRPRRHRRRPGRDAVRGAFPPRAAVRAPRLLRSPTTATAAARSPASRRSGSSRAPGSRPRPRRPRWSSPVPARARRRAR